MHKIMLIAAVAMMLAGMVGRAAAVEPQLFQIGDIKVWAIADNTGERDMSIFQAAPEVVKQYVSAPTSPSAVMCFLLRTPDETILFDAGNGNPASSRQPSYLLDGLKAIGVKPEEVDAVVITHMHGDHIGGLAWEGKPAFPNAVIKIGRIERDFWLDDASAAEYPRRKSGFDMAKQILTLYDGKVEAFEFGSEVAPGMTIVDARGHTPGHTGILVKSGGDRLLCVGDLLHAAALQFPRPDINSSYDMQDAATKLARRELLSRAAWEEIPIAGMHLPFPGVGRVKTDGADGFVYAPGLR